MSISTSPARPSRGARPRSFSILPGVLATTLGLVMLASVAGCGCLLPAVAPPVRVLPEYVKRISIPEFRNNSREYGIQADLTLKVHDAFLADGRLDVDDNARADLRLEGTVTQFTETYGARQGDRFPLLATLHAECKIQLWDPYDSDRVAPFATHTVNAQVAYVCDARRSVFEPRVQAMQRLYDALARNIVVAVITQSGAAPSALQSAAAKRYAERRGPDQYRPLPEPEPRYPDPIGGAAAQVVHDDIKVPSAAAKAAKPTDAKKKGKTVPAAAPTPISTKFK